MEGAARVFAAEFNCSTLSVRAPDKSGISYIVTPTGAWCDTVFISGALTELVKNGDMLRCRLSDPTGAFNIVAGGRRSELYDIFTRISVPSFIAVLGRATLIRKNGQNSVIVRAGSVNIINRIIRDNWVLRTADHTLQRIETLSCAIRGTASDAQVMAVLRHYHSTNVQLHEYISMVDAALATLRDISTGMETVQDPRTLIVSIIRQNQGTRGIAVDDVIALAELSGVLKETALGTIKDLLRDDECYQPQKGTIRLL